MANVIGEVDGRICILIDDILDSGGTLLNAGEALLEKGADAVYGYISHGVLSGGAVARINNSKLKELVITDSIQPTDAVKASPNIRVLSIATLIGEAISRTASEEWSQACSSTEAPPAVVIARGRKTPPAAPRVNLSQAGLWTVMTPALCRSGKSLHECQRGCRFKRRLWQKNRAVYIVRAD